MSVAAPQAFGVRRAARNPASASVVWWCVAAAALAAVLVVATFFNVEATALALLVAGAVLAIVIVQPAMGILMLMANFLVASYPSPIRGDGLLTINNILGVILCVLLVADLAQRPDLWYLRVRQLHVLVAIGIVF